jgi:hypothetical protein
MQTVTSREVQSRYGEFVEAVQDDLVCVTRHGRRLFWAVSDRHVSASDPNILIGRLLLLNGQMNRANTENAGEGFTTFLEAEIDPSISPGVLSVDEVTQFVDDTRR